MPSNYIICSTQRSGSSFFCECLSRAGCLGTPAEWLVFLEFNASSLGSEDAELKNKPLAEVIRERAERQRNLSGSEVVGWKIMWSTMTHMKGKLKRENDAILNSDFIATVFEQPKFIYFERSNKIAQAISHVILSKTQISHVRDEHQLETFESKKVQLDIKNDEITTFLRKQLADERGWTAFFQQNNIDPLRIVYEDFCNDVAAGVTNVAQFLDVVIDDSALSEVSRSLTLRKTRSEFERDLAQRYLTSLVNLTG